MNPVPKLDSLRQTVNPVPKSDRYPIPRVEDLLAGLEKGKSFAKIDNLSHAYQQLPLDKTSKQYVVINTQKVLFRYTSLPFGISSAPGIFQRVIESLIKGIPGVVAYIVVTGSTESEHLAALEEVLSHLVYEPGRRNVSSLFCQSHTWVTR